MTSAPSLFPSLPTQQAPKATLRPIKNPIWTEHKAHFIERYLYYFLMITKHGTYIDGFAGPQQPDKPSMWAAKLVLELYPRWLNRFAFCELNKQKVKALEQLVAAQPPRDKSKAEPVRKVKIFPGDINTNIAAMLEGAEIKDRTAAFCLLDQRTFECHWATVEKVAKYKQANNKIEIFYFLSNSWLKRALAAIKDTEKVRSWWGADNWRELRSLPNPEIATRVCQRFKEELGYKYVAPWPILDRKNGKKIMYYMIHATDHDAAPKLMERAYRRAVKPKETYEQLRMELGTLLATK